VPDQACLQAGAALRAEQRVQAGLHQPCSWCLGHAVYGPINYAGLRLITCGGTFDEKTKNYESNTVVFATLIHP